MRVLKFGGSSLATAERIRQVVEIVRRALENGPVTVVVSALGGATDRLLEGAQAAARAEGAYVQVLEELAERHRQAARDLVPAAEQESTGQRLEGLLAELSALLQGCYLVREVSPRTLDRVLSYGERLSALLVAAAFRGAGVDAADVDARRLIVTDDQFGAAQVDREATDPKVLEALSSLPRLAVVTGFIAATAQGETTTLGRGGSDYTASLLGAALDAEAVELWTDVDGVLNADPRLVPEAEAIDALSYIELMELSHFGAKVVHPPSVHPTRERGIPLWIKNTFRPEVPGTLVTADPPPDSRPVRGIASLRRLALLRLEGDGMVGVPGIAGRLFGALAQRGVNVILITQASSEHSICFGISPANLPAARDAVGKEFRLERRAGLVDELVVEEDQAVVAAVGKGMRERTGLAGRLFAILGREGINVRAIAQGSSELNISIVVAAAQEVRAVQALHEACFAGPSRTVELYLAGRGRVAKALLGQLARQQAVLEERRGLRLVLVGLAASRDLALNPAGLAPDAAESRLRPAASEKALEELLQALEQSRKERIFIDATASPAVAAAYDRILASGAALVTANKLHAAGPLAPFRSLLAKAGDRLYFETTVGAGLPVIRTLQDLMATGDTILTIEGLLSGTLTYLLDQLHQGVAFSKALRRAYDEGFTEPDPREDLGGRDVARKLLILARLAGHDLEPEAVEVESLLPRKPWEALSLEEFWQRLPELDETFRDRIAEARKSGLRAVYLARLDSDGAQVGLRMVASDHPAAGVRGSDSLIAFGTDRYRQPLVVRGPGAGPEVTAAGVFADILRAVAETPRLVLGGEASPRSTSEDFP